MLVVVEYEISSILGSEIDIWRKVLTATNKKKRLKIRLVNVGL